MSAKEEILTRESLLGEEENKDLVVEKEITMESASEELLSPPPSPSMEKCPEKPWYSDILGLRDLAEVMPHRVRFLGELQKLVSTRDSILKDQSLSLAEKQAEMKSLLLPVGKDSEDKVHLKDLW